MVAKLLFVPDGTRVQELSASRGRRQRPMQRRRPCDQAV